MPETLFLSARHDQSVISKADFGSATLTRRS